MLVTHRVRCRSSASTVPSVTSQESAASMEAGRTSQSSRPRAHPRARGSGGRAHRIRLCRSACCAIRSTAYSRRPPRSVRCTATTPTSSGSTAATRARATWAPASAGFPRARCWMRFAPSWRVRPPRPTTTPRRSGSASSAGSAMSCAARRWGSRSRTARGIPDAAFLRVDRAVAIAADGTAQLLALGDAWEGELAEWRDATSSSRRALRRSRTDPAAVSIRRLRRHSPPRALARDRRRVPRQHRRLPGGDPRGRGVSALPHDRGRGRGRVRSGRDLRTAARPERRATTAGCCASAGSAC